MNVSRETLAEIRRGASDASLVGFGVVPLGLAFGLLMTQAGFAWWWTPIFSTVIYAGSMEFLAINMVITGVGPLSSAITGFMVNFRHIFYGLTFPRHLIRSPLGRAYSTYALTDESYAIASATHPTTGARVLTVEVVCQLLWIGSGIVGALAGRIIPPEVIGLDFALTALFVVLAYEAFQASRDLSAVLIAAVVGIAVATVLPEQMLTVALTAYFLVVLARFWSPRLDSFLRWTV